MHDPRGGTPSGGTRAHRFACFACEHREDTFTYDCAVCGGPMLVDPAPVTADDLTTPELGARGPWRYPALLPRSTARVTIGEGDTPLVALPFAHRGSSPVYAKLESLNPSLSFKDRAMAVGASAAVDLGLQGLVVASTGNAAVSAATYAAAAGLACTVLVGSESQAAKKLDACRALGAEVREIEGDYSAAYARARTLEGEGWMNVSTTYRNPLLAEGYRSIAFELIEQLGRTPSRVIVPIGAGPLLRGVERGFADAVAAGRATHVPALVGVQAERVAPIHAAWRRRHGDGSASPTRGGATLATAIADRLTGYEAHGDVTIAAVERTAGTVMAVDETEIIAATRRLAAAGIWVEPSAATALAALGHGDAADPGVRAAHPALGDDADGPVVLMLTGHGIKAPTLPTRA
ncbi:pyridoxal-phosphate dependent enzyme [Agromyces aerolatus]|uniref:pyridoxal-phosphate dependent enzyme n=1 Tax=Agromyces sp. LY-1074 TaxID=3074080 RepID=UPI00285A27E3|nr:MULTISPECIES: pyridoxal-phosphate dependent enzyme [unclassified Agromyces]MDR5700193.1 pyridoxal-phosphate dependent enzyme [Agromyces sp. LY-1074]MDR5706439.1 pyridoxal-phosphate dependent enzyme [Agromyces sp. LY-1358]